MQSDSNKSDKSLYLDNSAEQRSTLAQLAATPVVGFYEQITTAVVGFYETEHYSCGRLL